MAHEKEDAVIIETDNVQQGSIDFFDDVSEFKGISNRKDADEALDYALQVSQHKDVDPEADRRLTRKIDMIVFPTMALVYAAQFLDKTSMSYAAVMGLQKDLKMKGNMYSWSGTSFYLGYLVFEYPAAWLLQRFPLAKTLGVFLIIWGFVLTLTSVATYPGFIAIRTILGMLESSTSMGFMLLTAQYYHRKHQGSRTSFWVAFNGLGQIIGGSMAYGLAKRQNTLPMPGWKLVFIICGVITIFLGFAFLLIIPDTPFKAWFLNDFEKELIVQRLRENQQGVGNHKFKRYQFIEALKDVRTWIMFFSSVALNIPNGGIGTFSSLLIKGTMGYDEMMTLLMGLPAGGCEFGGLILFGIISPFVKNRMLLASITTTIALIGSCLMSFAGPPKAQLAGYYLLMVSPGAMIVMFSIVSSNVSGYTKKTTVGAIYLIGYCVGNLIGPQTFKAQDAPEYRPAKIVMVAFYAITLTTLPLLYFVNRKENLRRDRLAEEGKIHHQQNSEFADLTDKENLEFRYVL
ncbi:LAMI_0A00320g1_1 [Lachancea mirantina]|uniref:LAMI_0A00320g1_1 n=1 Tax=Lachancea mirantina TaxID=1230905 RepID=A0A1G4IL89_9SACH|nr:LAMI_0A00320g1_1 [Lachancea mirantina]